MINRTSRKENNKKYDRKDPQSIESYGKGLIGKTFRQLLPNEIENEDSINPVSEKQKENKGKLGLIIEKYWFGYEPNSNNQPDFNEAGVELKVSPIIETNNSFSAKERLVITMINYKKDANKTFENSHLRLKLYHILLVSYVYEKTKNPLDCTIKQVKLINIPDADMRIIRDDYDRILKKINSGYAHEISEADTLYLGACTKGKNSHDCVQQPYSDKLAKRRAFCLKQKYMTYFINKYVLLEKSDCIPILKNPTNVTFEEYIKKKINAYKGWSIEELCQKFNINNSAKNRTTTVAFKILGTKNNKAEEFIKANIQVKSIRISQNGSIKESMSFPYFDFKKLSSESWEDDLFAETLRITKFFFIVYIYKNDGKLYLNGCQFWNMPNSDIDKNVYEVWKRTKQSINDGTCMIVSNGKIKYGFPKKKENPVCHVRPHGKNAQDTLELPDGRKCPKQCFWLNNTYIYSQLDTNVKTL